MKTAKLKDMERGWFIGNFSPSLLKTNCCEVAVKRYRAGDYEARHFHAVATEYTVVIYGRAKMFGEEFSDGDIVICEPYEKTDFLALQDTVCAVVKIPGATGDKFLCEEDD